MNSTYDYAVELEKLEPDQNLILYAIGALDKPLKSKVKIQKLFFLVTNVFKELESLFFFEHHLLGPYSEEVEVISSELIKLGFVKKVGSSFVLTPKGKEEYNNLKPREDLENVINDFKEFLNNMPDDKILTYIYVFYPDYIDESAKWDKLKENRVNTALYFLSKNKLSFSKAVKISGLPFKEFEKIAIQNNIRWRQ